MSSLADHRGRRLRTELDRVVERLVALYQPERVIVFGSMVHDQVGDWSDLDIAVIKQTNLPFLDRLLEVSRLVKPRVAADIVVYTPQEYNDMKQDGGSFISEIERGMVVYDSERKSVA
ncbi:MAG: nucleotidyltransferase domain-containing protein [Armatimonadetes bacterium]|nr:nucleotidyltransferase domain-containing protein [Armatimonadota bacterium]